MRASVAPVTQASVVDRIALQSVAIRTLLTRLCRTVLYDFFRNSAISVTTLKHRPRPDGPRAVVFHFAKVVLPLARRLRAVDEVAANICKRNKCSSGQEHHLYDKKLIAMDRLPRASVNPQRPRSL